MAPELCRHEQPNIMNARLLPLAAMAILLSGSAHAQLSRIVVQGSGSPQVFTDFAEAVTAAQPNDVLYLSGGGFSVTGGFAIDKPLHLIGAGIHPDSSSVTATTTLQVVGNINPLVITTAASGSSFTGIHFHTVLAPGSANALVRYGTSAADDQPTDIVFQRCRFTKSVQLAFSENSTPSTEATVFDECIFHFSLAGHHRGATVTRCIFDAFSAGLYAVHHFENGGLLMENCVLLGAVMANVYNGTIRNCISTSTNYFGYDIPGTTITNSVIAANVLSGAGTVNSMNNVTGADPSTFFVSETDNDYQFTDDLHLQPGCVGVGHGTNGTDVGIYGSSSPYKPGAVPFNPHFRQADIAPSTNNNGALPVNIRVAAQGH